MTSAGRYGEDLEGNLRLVEKLAPIHCIVCRGYHLSRVRKRLRPDHAHMLDRPQIMELVRHHALKRFSATPGRVDLLIAGTGDTNLLSTCAEAVSTLEPAFAGRLRYVAIDRCQTPLELCKVYAARYGLDLRTELVDMTETRRRFSADLILVHSLLRFAPAATHAAIMRRLMRWLRPDGAIIFSHRLMPDRAPTDKSEGALIAEYQTADQLRALFGESGLRVLSLREMDDRDTAQARGRKRVLAVLAAGD